MLALCILGRRGPLMLKMEQMQKSQVLKEWEIQIVRCDVSPSQKCLLPKPPGSTYLPLLLNIEQRHKSLKCFIVSSILIPRIYPRKIQ